MNGKFIAFLVLTIGIGTIAWFWEDTPERIERRVAHSSALSSGFEECKRSFIEDEGWIARAQGFRIGKILIILDTYDLWIAEYPVFGGEVGFIQQICIPNVEIRNTIKVPGELL